MTDFLNQRNVVNGVNGEEEGHDAVAATGRRQRVRVGACVRQQLSMEAVTVALTDFRTQISHRRLVQNVLGEREVLLDGESADVGAAHANVVFRPMAALEQRIGSQFVIYNLEEIVINRAISTNQLIHKCLTQIVIQCGEGADVSIDWHIFVECVAAQQQVERCHIVVDSRVRHALEGLGVAHVVGGEGHELVEKAVHQRITECAVGRTTADGGVAAVIYGNEGLDTAHAGAACIILRGEGEGAVEGVLRVEFSVEGGSRCHRIESVAPHIGADGLVVVEHDERLRSHGVAGLHTAVGQDVETDIALSPTERIVDREEAHLRTGRLETCSRVYTLEYPEKLVIHNIDTRGHIHPNTQRIRYIQALAVGRDVRRHSEEVAAEAKVGQAERGDVLLGRHIVCHHHAGSGRSREIGIVLKIDSVVHLVGGVDIADTVIIAHRSGNLVGVVGAVHLLARNIQGGSSGPALAIPHRAGDDGGSLRDSHRLAVAIPPFVGIWRGTARCRRGERHSRQVVTPDRHVARSGNLQLQVTIVLFFDSELTFEKDNIRTFLGNHLHRIGALRQAFHGNLIGSLHSGNRPFHLIIRRLKEGRHFEMNDTVFAWVAGLVLVHDNFNTFPRIFFLMNEGQMQRDGARTIIVIDVMIHIVATFKIGFPISRPGVAVAIDRFVLVVILSVLNRQVEGFGTGTTVQVGVFKHIVAAFRVKFPVGGPDMRFAVPVRLLVMGTMVDVEPQNLRNVASCRGSGDGIVRAALCVGDTVGRPSVGFAFRD